MPCLRYFSQYVYSCAKAEERGRHDVKEPSHWRVIGRLDNVHHEGHDQERDQAGRDEGQKVVVYEVVATVLPQVVSQRLDRLRLEQWQTVVALGHHSDHLLALLGRSDPIDLHHLDINLVQLSVFVFLCLLIGYLSGALVIVFRLL